MNSVRAVVLLLGLAGLSHGDCFFQELVLKDLNNPPTACEDKAGGRHAFGSAWVQDCYECSCTQSGVSCCSKVPEMDYMDIPNGCELVVNQNACSAKLVLKADKTKECPV